MKLLLPGSRDKPIYALIILSTKSCLLLENVILDFAHIFEEKNVMG